MAIKQLGNSDELTHFKLEAEGDTLVGYYMGTRDVVTKKGPAVAFDFVTPEGIKGGILGSAGIKGVMENALPGLLTTLIRGQKVKTKSGNDFVRYSGHQDDEDFIEVDGSPESKQLA